MSLQSVANLSFDIPPSRRVQFEISNAPLSSDAELPPMAMLDERKKVIWNLPARANAAIVSLVCQSISRACL